MELLRGQLARRLADENTCVTRAASGILPQYPTHWGIRRDLSCDNMARRFAAVNNLSRHSSSSYLFI